MLKSNIALLKEQKQKVYDVLLMDGQLDTHFINHMEQKLDKCRFVRVDGDVAEKLIPKENTLESKLLAKDKDDLTAVFTAKVPNSDKMNFIVAFEAMGADANPAIITQQEFMRRMKEMSAMQGGGMNFYG